MEAQAQFTIHSLNDVIASTTAPSSPYKGQLWVNTSYSPPRTFVYNGSAWKEQNGTDTLRSNISTLTTKSNTMRSDLDGLTSTVSAVTTRVETVEDDLGAIEENILDVQSSVSELEQTASSIALRVTQNETDISALEMDVSGIKTRVSNAEGDITSLEQTATSLTTRISSAEGSITTLTTSVNGLKTRVTNVEGDVSILEQTTSSLSASVSSKLSASGGSSSSFGWSLTSSGFYLYSNRSTVMSITSSGLSVTGSINAISGNLSDLYILGSLYFGETGDYYLNPNYDNGSWYIYLPKFRVNDTSAYFSGTLQAPSGTIGGFTISTASIYKTKTAYSNSTEGVYLGTDGIGLGKGTFYVTAAGALTATSATITGAITATSGTMQNMTITGKLYFGNNSTYYINANYNDSSYYIYLPGMRSDDASGTVFSGKLSAPSGTIGGFTISSSAIYKTKTSYNSTTAGVYIGTNGIGLGAGTFYVTSAGALTASNVNITGGSIAFGASNNQNYLSMTSSRILLGIANSVYTQLNWSGITIGMDQWGLGICNKLNLGAFGGADTGISSFGVHAYLDPDGDNIMTISAEDTNGSYMGSGYIELRIGTTYSKCYGYLGSTWKSSSSITVSSDRNIKNSIADMPTAYSVLFDKLRPVIFKYNEGTGGRYHTGFIAQEVAEAVTSSGLTLSDFAAVCAPYRDDDVWGIRYEEIISLNTWEIQKLKSEIKALKAQIGGSR